MDINWKSVLRPTKQSNIVRDIYGFDIETFGDDNRFLCCSFYSVKTGESWWFRSKENAIRFLKRQVMVGAFIFATNLSFDFHGLFEDTDEWNRFALCMRSSHLISATTWRCQGSFCSNRDHDHTEGKITFVDTMNYAPMGVEKLGKLIGIEKLPTPKWIGSFPKDEEQWRELQTYNRRDAEVSGRAAKFLYDGFYAIGATPKLTIASTAMSVFRNRFLRDWYFTLDSGILKELFEGYYGARTEAFCRGSIGKYNYYDINSLYPSVMRDNAFPNPNTLRVNRDRGVDCINEFEGMSDVDVEVPDMKYPPLPCRGVKKLLFPIGKFRSIQTHVELREAMRRGVKILKIHKTWWTKETCRPFTDFVNTMYANRKLKKERNDPTEIIDKLVMNSLYGKFGQKFTDMEEIVNADQLTVQQCRGDVTILEKDRWIKVLKEETRPAVFCIPLWASYVTSYGRIRLLEFIEQCDPVYVDTDSLITKKTLHESKELGMLKKEMVIKEGVIVRPKMYGLVAEGGNEMVKLKGVNSIRNMKDFLKVIDDGCVDMVRFARFKEALRRKLPQNSIMNIRKELGFEDDKRVWPRKFNVHEFQESKPPVMDIVGGKNVRIR